MRYLGMTVCAVVALVLLGGVAQAAGVNSLFVKDGVSINTADDASAEYISNGGQTTNDYDNTRTISVNDVIRGAFNISRINSTQTNVGVDNAPVPGVPFTPNEWTGAFAIRVVSITEVDATPDGNPLEQDWTIVFGADANFDDWLNAISAGAGAGMVAGTAVRMWEDSTRNFDILSKDMDADEEDADAHVATGMDGTLFWDLGFGTRGSTWIATNSALTAPANSIQGLAVNPANFELTLLSNFTGVSILFGGMIGQITGANVDFIGNTSIFGAGNNDSGVPNEETAGFHARDKATLQFVAVPTPSAVWAGLALMGVLGVSRIRRRRKVVA